MSGTSAYFGGQFHDGFDLTATDLNAALVAAQGGAQPIANMTTVASMAATDLVGISQAGVDVAINLQDMLGGVFIAQGSGAAPPSSTDTVWVGQGGSSMVVQTFGAILAYVLSSMVGWKRNVFSISANTLLDGSQHTNAILVVTQPITISPAFTNQGSGFTCTIINVSSGAVTLASGFTTSSGSLSVPVGQVGEVIAATYTGGNLNYVSISGPGVVGSAPGQVTGLTVGAVTASSLALTWTAPASGGAPASYTVNWRVTSVGGAWTGSASVSGTSYTIAGLAAATQYDTEIIAVNAAGSGTASSVVSGTTGAAVNDPPNTPTAVAVGSPTSSTLTVSWTASVQDSSHGAAATYTAQWRVTGTTSWTQQSGVTGTAYTPTGLLASTTYDVQVQATNAYGSSAFTATANGSTAASSGNYAMLTGFLPNSTGTSYGPSASVEANASDASASGDGSHTVPTAVYFGWGTSSTVAPTSTSGMTIATTTFANSGHNYWAAYVVPTPASAGTYYFWSVETDSAGAVVASVVQSSGGSPVAFTIT